MISGQEKRLPDLPGPIIDLDLTPGGGWSPSWAMSRAKFC
jgi:hypothetical protein